jgi:hypothetical protein
MERISGPYRGYFIAAYSVESGSQFIGYAKVCIDEPESVWNATSVEKLTSATGCKTELEALTAAEKKARQAIGDILGSWDTTSMPGELN